MPFCVIIPCPWFGTTLQYGGHDCFHSDVSFRGRYITYGTYREPLNLWLSKHRLIQKLNTTVLLGDPQQFCLVFKVGVDRLSAPILSILPIIDIGHFHNRFADIYIFFYYFFYYANKHTIYRWHYLLVNKLYRWNYLIFKCTIWLDAACLSSTLWPRAISAHYSSDMICRESRVRPINTENWRQSHTESTC